MEAARDSGTSLAFLSGNEVYWRTRWEPSKDGSNTRQPHAGLLQGDLGPPQKSDHQHGGVDRHLA